MSDFGVSSVKQDSIPLQAGIAVTSAMIHAGVTVLLKHVGERAPPGWALAPLIVEELLHAALLQATPAENRGDSASRLEDQADSPDA